MQTIDVLRYGIGKNLITGEIPRMSKVASEVLHAFGQISDDAEENRIVIRFAAKPSREMLDKLRSRGFKWSPARVLGVNAQGSRAPRVACREASESPRGEIPRGD